MLSYLVTEVGIRCCPALDDAVTVCSMGSQRKSCSQLSESQLTGLAVIIYDECGGSLNRDQFNNEAMNLLDDIAGIESLTTKARTKYLNAMWSSYQQVQPVSQLH